MNDFKNWCRVFVVLIIVGGILQKILPTVKANMSFRILFSIIIVNVLIMPFSEYKLIKNESLTIASQYKVDKNELISSREQLITGITSDALKDNINSFIYKINKDAYIENIDILINDESIDVIFIEIFGNLREDEKDKINEYIFNIIGGDVEVEYK